MKLKRQEGSDPERIKALLLSDRLGSADGYSELLSAEAALMLSKFIEVDKSRLKVSVTRIPGGSYRIEMIAETDHIKNLKFV